MSAAAVVLHGLLGLEETLAAYFLKKNYATSVGCGDKTKGIDVAMFEIHEMTELECWGWRLHAESPTLELSKHNEMFHALALSMSTSLKEFGWTCVEISSCGNDRWVLNN